MVKSKSGWIGSAIALAATAVLMGASSGAMAAAQERLIVIYKPGASAAVKAQVTKAGGQVVREIKRVNALAVRVSSATAAALKKSPNVEIVEADAVRTVMGGKTQRPSNFVIATTDSGEVVPYGIPMVQADQVSDANTGNRKLCVIDSGIDAKHEDLSANKLDGVNLTTSGEWYTDEGLHGSHVTGTIAAIGGNRVGVVGVNPGANLNLYIAKVFDASGSTESSTVMDAVVRCAEAGANIISMSLGGGFPTWGERRIFNQLAEQGILLIASAGNTGDNTANFPAAYGAVMSVAAIDANMVRAGFSTYNRDVEISGPGVATLSTIPPNINVKSSLAVGGTGYDSAGMDGSVVGSATAPLYNFGTGEVDDPGVAGKVCLIARGNISFADKVLRCQANGGAAAVIYNNTAGMLFGTLGGAATTIPSLGTSDVIGAALLGKLGQSATVAITPDPALYGELSGTSMAAPHVSGVAALVWSYFPSCPASVIRQALNATAMDLGSPGRDYEYGFGLVQAKAALSYLREAQCQPSN